MSLPLHYLKFGECVQGFDRSRDETTAFIHEHGDGDGLQFAQEYFEALCLLLEKGQFDILDHFIDTASGRWRYECDPSGHTVFFNTWRCG